MRFIRTLLSLACEEQVFLHYNKGSIGSLVSVNKAKYALSKQAQDSIAFSFRAYPIKHSSLLPLHAILDTRELY